MIIKNHNVGLTPHKKNGHPADPLSTLVRGHEQGHAPSHDRSAPPVTYGVPMLTLRTTSLLVTPPMARPRARHVSRQRSRKSLRVLWRKDRAELRANRSLAL